MPESGRISIQLLLLSLAPHQNPFIGLIRSTLQMSARRELNSNDEEGTVKAIDRSQVSEIIRDNALRVIDEMARLQPQFLQSISNLQIDWIQTCKNTIQTAVSAHKEIASAMNISIPAPISELFARQLTEITNNAIGSAAIFNQLTINTIDAARENIKIYGRTADTLSDYNNNIWRAWGSFWASQLQFF